MTNPEFNPVFSTNDIWRNQDTNRCLTDDLDAMDVDIASLEASIDGLSTSFAPVNHTHNGYALVGDVEAMQSAISSKADANHIHTEYAAVSHTHNGYVAMNDFNELESIVTGKSDLNHTHSASDIGADVSGAANTALTSAKEYTNQKIDALVGTGASTTLDTIGEISAAIEDNQDAIDLLNSAIGTKANTSSLDSHTTNTTTHITANERTNWNAAKAHADSNHAPSNAEVNQNAFSNITVGNTTIAADTKTDTVTLVGSNVTLTPDNTNDKVTIGITKTNVTSALGYTPPTADTTYNVATQSTNGLMSSSDKTKLNGIASGANNYTLPSAGSSLGGVKTGGDVTISNGVIAVNDDSHNHTIANIDELQSTLDGKAASNHEHYAVTVTTANEDLNNYVNAGIYTFAQAYAPKNVPVGTNGWLVVIPWQKDSVTVKQLWFRHGTIDSNDFETYVRTKVGDSWGTWSKYFTSNNPPTSDEVGAISKDIQITADNGDVKESLTGQDVLAVIKAKPSGMYTFYSKGGNTNNPKTTESWRFIVHKTGTNFGWVLGFGSSGSIYSNYIDSGSWKGWKCIYDATNKMILWSGASYLTSTNGTPQTVTPSKKLSECRTGWLLLWSDYDPGDGANDIDFATTFIPKFNPAGGTWGGKAFLCDIPAYVGGDPNDASTEKRIIKPVYVHDNCLKGSYQNTSGGRNDVVLRAVYEM